MISGFSTGSLAKGNFTEALHMLAGNPNPTSAIELSTLREHELPLLLKALPSLDLSNYKHISIHAPSKLTNCSEDKLIEQLHHFVHYGYPIIVHPDIIVNFEKWKVLGNLLCIENMDKRKAIGRTTEDLKYIFDLLPEASFCLDLAHAKQVDPSMSECVKMLRSFKEKLIQFHISDVTSDCNHVPINLEAIQAYRKLSELIPLDKPFIIESPVSAKYINREINYISSIFHTNNHNYQNTHSFVTTN